MLDSGGHVGGTSERWSSCQHLEQHNAEGVVAHQARLDAPEAAASVPHERGDAVDGAVDDPEVEAAVQPLGAASDGAPHQVRDDLVEVIGVLEQPTGDAETLR